MLIRKIFFLMAFCSVSIGVDASNFYKTIEKTSLYTLELRLSNEILSITPLKKIVFKRFKVASDEVKKNADKLKKQRQGDFVPLSLDTKWQVTFENASIISISGITYEFQGGAHPNTYFESIVWQKKSQSAIPLRRLFNENQSDLALKAIAEAAQKSWIKIFSARSHEAPTPDLIEQSKQGIKPDSQSLKNYVLTHAKGQTKANGIMLLYGAGEIWPHVLGEFRIPIPQNVFYQYLRPEWRFFFSRAHYTQGV